MSIILLDEVRPSSLQQDFKNKLAHKPYCSDDLGYGLQIRDKQIALLRKYIQANSPHKLYWIVFDIDYPCVLETTFKEKILPTPNLVVVNPENSHSHLLYGLKEGVYLTDNANLAPLRYAKAIEYSLRQELMADSGYSGLIIKNPQNTSWNTLELNEELWSLGELGEYLTLPKTMPKRENLIGLGRNCTLFELGRKYAYSEVLKQKIMGNTKDGFYQVVLHFIEQHNQDFPNPLMFNEYKGIAKSISNWTWKHYGDKTTKQWAMYVKRTHTSEMQAYRGRLGGKANTNEQQSIKGKIGGKNNSSDQQRVKGKANTSEQQKIKALKSAQVRYKGSNEETKPWESLGISRSWYYTQKRLGAI